MPFNISYLCYRVYAAAIIEYITLQASHDPAHLRCSMLMGQKTRMITRSGKRLDAGLTPAIMSSNEQLLHGGIVT